MVHQKMARWSSGLRLRPLTPATWVRIPYGSPIGPKAVRIICTAFSTIIVTDNYSVAVGVYGDEGTPVPIPNTEVKLICAENTLVAMPRKDRATPT